MFPIKLNKDKDFRVYEKDEVDAFDELMFLNKESASQRDRLRRDLLG